MIFLGVDPGLHGAMVALRAHGNRAEIVPTPILTAPKGRDQYDLAEIADKLRAWKQQAGGDGLMLTIERQQPMPLEKGGTIANYNRGRSLAVFESMAVALAIPYQLVLPRVWQAQMLEGTQGDDTKQRSIIAAKRLFPEVSLRRTERSRKDDDGISDAILLAEYGRRITGRR
jgi:hypothetical protein